jgi:RNA polymerase sigma-70 factor (ECF subfamily)
LDAKQSGDRFFPYNRVAGLTSIIHPTKEFPMKLACSLLMVVAISNLAWADEITLETAQPVIVKTSPQSGAMDIDAKTKEIQVTFSKNMADNSWSWIQLSDESIPKIIGKPKYLKDKRTCVVSVKLEPGKTYAIWLNSEKFGNFKDVDGRSAVPYLLVFKTAK